MQRESVNYSLKAQQQLVAGCAGTQHSAAYHPSSTVHTVLHAASNTDCTQKNCTHLWNARANESSKQHSVKTARLHSQDINRGMDSAGSTVCTQQECIYT